MENFKRTYQLGLVKPWEGARRRARCTVEVEYCDGRLSLTGNIGRNQWGQVRDRLTKVEPDAPWTLPKLRKLIDIWNRWHLNDMRAECEHQRALGWRDEARESVPLFCWQLSSEASDARYKLQHETTAALLRGEARQYTPEQVALLALPFDIKTPSPFPPDPRYVPGRYIVENKALGWLRESEHPRGLLCKPCPTCGYAYGSKWLREEVPEEVLQWLADPHAGDVKAAAAA